MAFIEHMHRNIPNIIYLLTLKYGCPSMFWFSQSTFAWEDPAISINSYHDENESASALTTPYAFPEIIQMYRLYITYKQNILL